MRSLVWSAGQRSEVIGSIAHEFSKGTPVILPTDTLYGLAAPVKRLDAVRNLLEIKKRPAEQALPVAVGSLEGAAEIAYMDAAAMDLLRSDDAGPLTVVLPARGGLPAEVVREGTVAVRVLPHPLFGPLCDSEGPIALTSANVHGGRPVRGIDDARVEFKGHDLLMVTDPVPPSGTPSRIVDMTGPAPRTIRGGTIKMDERMG